MSLLREFQELTELAKAEGIGHVVGGPLVRSSYRAGETIDLLTKRLLSGQLPSTDNTASIRTMRRFPKLPVSSSFVA